MKCVRMAADGAADTKQANMKNRIIFLLMGLLCLSAQGLMAQHLIKGKLIDEQGG